MSVLFRQALTTLAKHLENPTINSTLRQMGAQLKQQAAAKAESIGIGLGADAISILTDQDKPSGVSAKSASSLSTGNSLSRFIYLMKTLHNLNKKADPSDLTQHPPAASRVFVQPKQQTEQQQLDKTGNFFNLKAHEITELTHEINGLNNTLAKLAALEQPQKTTSDKESWDKLLDELIQPLKGMKKSDINPTEQKARILAALAHLDLDHHQDKLTEQLDPVALEHPGLFNAAEIDRLSNAPLVDPDTPAQKQKIQALVEQYSPKPKAGK